MPTQRFWKIAIASFFSFAISAFASDTPPPAKGDRKAAIEALLRLQQEQPAKGALVALHDLRRVGLYVSFTSDTEKVLSRRTIESLCEKRLAALGIVSSVEPPRERIPIFLLSIEAYCLDFDRSLYVTTIQASLVDDVHIDRLPEGSSSALARTWSVHRPFSGVIAKEDLIEAVNRAVESQLRAFREDFLIAQIQS